MFEQLFTAVLRQCTEAGLVGGRRLLVDATHIEADAALKSLRAELSVVEHDGDGDGDGERRRRRRGRCADASRVRRLTLAEPRTGPTPEAHGSQRDRGLADATRTPSCATSPGSARIWCIAARSPSIPSGG